MTETPFDPDSLTAEYNQVLSEEPSSDSAPDVAEGSHLSDPASGSHPEATPADAAPPDSSPEGSHPTGQSLADAEDSDFKHALELAGIKDPTNVDPKVLAKKLTEFNQRNAALAQELKALKAGTVPAEPVTPTNQATAAPVVPPASVVAPVVPLAPPAPPATEQDIETRVTEAVSQDQPYLGFAADYERLRVEANAIVSRDAAGNFVGPLNDLDVEIAEIQRLLTPPEALKKAGLPVPELDEYERTKWEDRLARLELTRSVNLSKLHELKVRGESVLQRMETRKSEWRQHLHGQAEAAKRDEERESGIETSAQRYLTEWASTFKSVTKALGVEEGDLPDFQRLLHREALANQSVLDDIAGFMERTIKDEQARLDKAYRSRQAKNGSLKRADGTQSAPTGAAAVAPPLPTANKNWEEALEASAAAEYRSARA